MRTGSPRLCVLAHASVLDRGGYARRVLDCARTLRTAFAGAAITIVSVESPTRRCDAAATDEVRAACATLDADLVVVGAWPRRMGLAALADRRSAREVARRLARDGVDLVHAHGPRAARAALAAAYGTRIRVVVDVHGDRAAEERLERGERDSLDTPPDPAEAGLVASADGVIHASDALAQRFPPRAGAPTGVVPCLLDPARIRGDADAQARRDELRRELGLSGEEWVAAYAGSLATWQEVPRVVALAQHLVERVPQFRLLVVTPERERAIALVRAGGVAEGRFRVLSPSADAVVDTLLAADAGVLLRRPAVANAVAFPTKAAAYLAAGLALVTTDAVRSLAELVARRPVAGHVLSFEAEDAVLAARLAGASRPSSAAERAARRAIAREELSLDAAVPVYRAVHGAVLGRRAGA